MPIPTQTTNLLYAFAADAGVFSDAGGTNPAPVGGPVARVNNLGSLGGQLAIYYPAELKLGQDGATDGGKKYLTNATTIRNANGGGDVRIAAPGLSGPRTFYLIVRRQPVYTEVAFAEFGGGFDALTAANTDGDVRFKFQVGQPSPYLPANALQLLVISIDGAVGKYYVNGLLRSTFDASINPFSSFYISAANLRLYAGGVYGQAADTALLNALQTDQRAIQIQPTHERLGHSYNAPAGAGASSIYQCLSNRVFETLRAVLKAAPVPSSPICINRAIGGRDDSQVKADLMAEVSVASPSLGPTVCEISGVTNTAARPGSVPDGQAAAAAYLSIADEAKLKAYDKIYGIVPAFASYGPGVTEAIQTAVVANQTGGHQAFDKVFDVRAHASRALRSNGSFKDAIFKNPDGLHENNNEHSLDASAECPDIAGAMVGYMSADQQAVALAKKPVPSAPVISSDRLTIRIAWDMPIEVRNPVAYGRNMDGNVVSATLTAADFAGEKKQDGSDNPITYFEEYKQVAGLSLLGGGAITITKAVTPPDDIATIELTLSQPLPAPGTVSIRLVCAQTNTIKNHLGNAAASFSVQLVDGPPAAPANMTATPGVNAISLTWSHNDDARYTEVRQATGGPILAVFSGDGGTLPNLTPGTAYTFHLKHVGATGLTSSETIAPSMTPIPAFDASAILFWTFKETGPPATQRAKSTQWHKILVSAQDATGAYLSPADIRAAGIQIAFEINADDSPGDDVDDAWHDMVVGDTVRGGVYVEAFMEIGPKDSASPIVGLKPGRYQRWVRVATQPGHEEKLTPFIMEGANP